MQNNCVTQEVHTVASLQARICELLIKNQQLRTALMEMKAREQMDCAGHGA
jgi:FtsZ-binding cell division protein ZapB